MPARFYFSPEKPKIQYCKTDKSNVMKRRVRKIANFFAFNLLFFALYLNFIHKDNVNVAIDQNMAKNNPAFSGTVLVDNSKAIDNKTVQTAVPVQQPAEDKTGDDGTAALRLSIN